MHVEILHIGKMFYIILKISFALQVSEFWFLILLIFNFTDFCVFLVN